jgi:hypothetical protein
LDPIALAANCTIEFLDLPTGVFLKPGGIWANRMPAFTDMEWVEVTANRYFKASIVRYNKFGQNLAIFAGTNDDLYGAWGLTCPLLLSPAIPPSSLPLCVALANMNQNVDAPR